MSGTGSSLIHAHISMNICSISKLKIAEIKEKTRLTQRAQFQAIWVVSAMMIFLVT